MYIYICIRSMTQLLRNINDYHQRLGGNQAVTFRQCCVLRSLQVGFMMADKFRPKAGEVGQAPVPCWEDVAGNLKKRGTSWKISWFPNMKYLEGLFWRKSSMFIVFWSSKLWHFYYRPTSNRWRSFRTHHWIRPMWSSWMICSWSQKLSTCCMDFLDWF